MQNFTVTAIPAFKDNYIWLIADPVTRKALVVDPGAAAPVLDYLADHQLQLQAILITHHHADHSGGVLELKKQLGKQVIVYAPKKESKKIAYFDVEVGEGDRIVYDFCQFTVIEIPGHTLGHIAYVGEQKIFCGDTLFSVGCGRVFEGTPRQMLNSLHKIAALDDEMQLFCGHEYTQNNILFALQVEPNNIALHQYAEEVSQVRSANRPTLPTRLGLEKAINPFLRCFAAEIKQTIIARASHIDITNEVNVFSYLREWKNNF